MIDELAVAQVAHDGHRMALRGADLEAAVQAMRHHRVPVDLMAWRLHLTPRTVERVLSGSWAVKTPPCGTWPAYRRHVHQGETICDECMDWKVGNDRRLLKPARPKSECGTDAAYARHRRKGEDACTACKRAHAERKREDRKSRK